MSTCRHLHVYPNKTFALGKFFLLNSKLYVNSKTNKTYRTKVRYVQLVYFG